MSEVGQKADLTALKHDFRYSPESGHRWVSLACPLSAITGLMRRGKSPGSRARICKPSAMGMQAARIHSISRSARSMIDCGIERLSAVAVFMLINISNLVGCSTGRSAGFVPLKILSTYSAARCSMTAWFGP
jgi:hypothetical protein